jgi:hypothetical protein
MSPAETQHFLWDTHCCNHVMVAVDVGSSLEYGFVVGSELDDCGDVLFVVRTEKGRVVKRPAEEVQVITRRVDVLEGETDS